MTSGSTALPAAAILMASPDFEKTASAAGTSVPMEDRVAWAPAVLMAETRAAPAALGMENVSSACATQSFSEASTEPGRQMPFLPTGTAELAGLNYFWRSSIFDDGTDLTAALFWSFCAKASEPPSVTQLEGETPL